MDIGYCDECGWSITTEDAPNEDLNQAMIDHFVDAEHAPVIRIVGDSDDSTCDTEWGVQVD